MIRYYCDRCGNEIKRDQYESSPCICEYKEEYPLRFKLTQSDCKLCVDCMRKYIIFLKGGDKK